MARVALIDNLGQFYEYSTISLSTIHAHSSCLLNEAKLRRQTNNRPDVLTMGRLFIGRQRIIVTCILVYKMLK